MTTPCPAPRRRPRPSAPRRLLPGLIALSLVAPPAAANDELSPERRADAYVNQGILLAKKDRKEDWDEAIVMFRAAEKIFPRALHDCNIGSVYAKSDRPHLAWYYLGRCSSRSSGNLPDWVDERRKESIEKLTAGDYAPVDLSVTPGGAVSFSTPGLPGEVFTPVVTNPGAPGTMTLWLPFGTHALSFEAKDHVAESRAVVVDASVKQKKPRERVEVALAAVPKPDPVAPPQPVSPLVYFGPPIEPAGRAMQIVGWSLVGTGVLSALVSAYFWNEALDLRDELKELPVGDPDHTFVRGEFDSANVAASALTWGGVGLAGVGTLLVVLDTLDRPTRALDRLGGHEIPARRNLSVGLDPLPGGGLFSARGSF
jgi:hypothetical protein